MKKKESKKEGIIRKKGEKKRKKISFVRREIEKKKSLEEREREY